MTASITPLIAGNWKMNGLRVALAEVDALLALVAGGPKPRADIVICPPATLLAELSARLADAAIATGGQNCHSATGGAHTGDISAPMLADAGAKFVIMGHSERRAAYGETDALVGAKALAALGAGLVPIICVGETLEELNTGRAEAVVGSQLAGSIPGGADQEAFVIAYEPVWAIGTQTTPAPTDIARMHSAIRRQLTERFGARGAGIRILYGGSLKPENARTILAIPDVNGALVGGASLLSSDFYAIISAL